MKAKKHLGQHFLIDAMVIDKILEAISQNCSIDMPILEVGPGPGVLTKALNEHFKNFKAVELDEDMVERLRLLLKPNQLLHEDFLKLELDTLFEGEAFNLVGNFPYNISSQIVFKMVESTDKIPVMVGMFQKELAERICAVPKTKANGILSLMAQAFYDAEILFTIGPDAFDPPPKVDSAVILLKRKEHYELPCDFKIYKRLIKQAFQQRRKKMRNTLKSYNLDLTHEIFQKRPEELGVADFVNIVNMLNS